MGYPGSFSITDKFGNVSESEDGMIAIMDPASGDYDLQVNPTGSSTDFIVGQFLSNGQTEYKEYKFKGSTLKPKTIKFDSKKTIKNPVQDKVNNNIPPFPVSRISKFWFNFWKFWSWFRR